MNATPPPWQVREWLNADVPLSLESLRGKVVLLEAFQMPRPGCFQHEHSPPAWPAPRRPQAGRGIDCSSFAVRR